MLRKGGRERRGSCEVSFVGGEVDSKGLERWIWIGQ